MNEIEQRLVSQRWDAEYRAGRYENDGPLPFVDRIISILENRGIDGNGTGLYVGCGNGRNFVPLAESGIKILGIDISSEALHQIATSHPSFAGTLVRGDLLAPPFAGAFPFLIAIQVLQHGLWTDIEAYFAKAAQLISNGGYLFLRVNSISTEIAEPHARLDDGKRGGLTIKYVSGPKAGLPIHFYSQEELAFLTAENFEPIGELEEVKLNRASPKTGSWAQWEGVWKKRGGA